MRAISATVEIEAPPERVCAVLSDFGAYPEWNPFISRPPVQLAGRGDPDTSYGPRPGSGDDVPAAGCWRQQAGRAAALDRTADRTGIFDGTHQFAAGGFGGRTRLSPVRDLRGIWSRSPARPLRGPRRTSGR